MSLRFSLIAALLFALLPGIVQAQYCTPAANCTVGDGIRLVAVGPFSNASDCEADMGVDGYGDFTALPGLSLGQGVTYEAMFQSAYAGQQFSIWIDMDNNMTFEPSEIILTDFVVGLDVVTTSLTIPVDLDLGDYRMRVKATWNGPSSGDACEQGTYGEIEDYTLTVTTPPSCINVSGLEITALSATEATITWIDPGTSEVWDIEWGLQGFTPVGFPSEGFDDIDNPATLTDLNAVTTYDVYIRADCGMDNVTDISLWTSAFSFTTACGAVVPTYTENFNDGLGDCWIQYGSGDLVTGPMDEGFSNWFDDGFANTPNVFSGSQGISMFGSNNNHWLVSPDIDLGSGGPYQLEFDLSMTEAFAQTVAQMGADDKFRLILSEDFGANWTTIDIWDAASEITPSGDHMVYDLSMYAGSVVRFGYYISNGEVDDFLNYNAFIDNFKVQDLGAPMTVEVDLITEPVCFTFGNQLADVLINVSGGVPPYTYLWTNGDTTEDLIDSEQGIVTVTVTDGAGVEFVSDPIDVPGTPVLTATAIITDETYQGFNDGTVTITGVEGGNGQYTYFWNSGATEESIDGLIAAYWCVTITDGNGCNTDTCFEVMEGLPPTGISVFEHELGLELFPNPMENGVSQLQANLSSGDDWEIRITDAVGRLVSSEYVQGGATYRGQLNISEQESGVYLMRLIRRKDGAHISKLLVR